MHGDRRPIGMARLDDSTLAALLLTSRLVPDGPPPLKAREFWALVESVGGDPAVLLGEDPPSIEPEQAARVRGLLDRATAFAFALEDAERAGINIVSAFDVRYPPRLRERLGDQAPPALHVAGPMELMVEPGLALVAVGNDPHAVKPAPSRATAPAAAGHNRDAVEPAPTRATAAGHNRDAVEAPPTRATAPAADDIDVVELTPPHATIAAGNDPDTAELTPPHATAHVATSDEPGAVELTPAHATIAASNDPDAVELTPPRATAPVATSDGPGAVEPAPTRATFATGNDPDTAELTPTRTTATVAAGEDRDVVALARACARAAVGAGLTVITGGADAGIDAAVTTAALEAGGRVVAVLADPLTHRIRRPEVRRAIHEGRLCLATPYHPDAPYSPAADAGRIKLLVALADLTLVIDGDEVAVAQSVPDDHARVAVWREPDGGGAALRSGDRQATSVHDLGALIDLATASPPPTR